MEAGLDDLTVYWWSRKDSLYVRRDEEPKKQKDKKKKKINIQDKGRRTATEDCLFTSAKQMVWIVAATHETARNEAK